MRTLSHAPWMALRRLRAATPRSLAALSLNRPSRLSVSSRVSAASSIISMGVSIQPRRAAWIALDRAAFSSSVPLGRAKAAATALKASVSRSITSRNRTCKAAHFSRTDAASSWLAAYLAFPTVRPQTMAVRAAPRAPSRAAVEPPPGAGASEARRSANAVTSSFFSSIPAYSIPTRWYSMT